MHCNQHLGRWLSGIWDGSKGRNFSLQPPTRMDWAISCPLHRLLLPPRNQCHPGASLRPNPTAVNAAPSPTVFPSVPVRHLARTTPLPTPSRQMTRSGTDTALVQPPSPHSDSGVSSLRFLPRALRFARRLHSPTLPILPSHQLVDNMPHPHALLMMYFDSLVCGLSSFLRLICMIVIFSV